MASTALNTWRSSRAARLNELVAAHRTMGGVGPGRRWRTEQLNWALVLRLAAEFQGFARDLHTLGSGWFAKAAAATKPGVEDVILTELLRDRRLDRGNAQPASLGDDFGRFGIAWWPALTMRDRRTEARQDRLQRVNQARNAIIHDHPHVIAGLRAEGSPLTLPVIRQWWRALDGLAGTMDLVLAAHLGGLFGRPDPW